MSQDSEHASVDRFMDVNDEPVAHGVASSIHTSDNRECYFHVTRTMLYLIHMKGLFGGLANKDDNLHIRNFAKIFQAFNITTISQESIQLRLFPFSLTRVATTWLEELPQGSITS